MFTAHRRGGAQNVCKLVALPLNTVPTEMVVLSHFPAARSSGTNKHPYKSPPFIKYASVGEWRIGDPLYGVWMSADRLQ